MRISEASDVGAAARRPPRGDGACRSRPRGASLGGRAGLGISSSLFRVRLARAGDVNSLGVRPPLPGRACHPRPRAGQAQLVPSLNRRTGFTCV